MMVRPGQSTIIHVMAHCVLELEFTSIVRYQQKRKNIGFLGGGEETAFFHHYNLHLHEL